MTLPLAARQHFLEHGYAIVPNVLSSSMVERIRSAALASTTARSRSFAHLPNVHSLLKSTPKCTDPLQDGPMSHLQKRRYILRYYRDIRRHKRRLRRAAKAFLNGRDVSELGREDMLQLSEMVSAETQKVWSRGCTSTVKTDPQMLMAINQYRANAWMTNAQLEAVLRDNEEFVKPLSQLAEVVGGVARPVIFGDVPLLREAYGNPVGYHCLAPTIGTRTNARVSKGGGEATAVSMVLFTYTPTPLCLPPFVMRNSQHAVRRQYLHSVRAERLWRPFAPMEADVRDQLRRFQFDASVVGQPLLAAMAGPSSAPAAPVIGPGTVMVVDPHLMMAFGGNMTPQSEVLYRINVVAENARPHLMAPSWIRGWRTMPEEVHFASPVVFPPLYVE
ncbi:hypothetical protein conserved [Leishmania donovani]|uniref:Hypothetical_protein_conserved n=1 Tax=Leishmania donovani TaxID=5661 RepID=A0A504XKC7_LEIDO|nr:hypothetical protein CGC20_14860 [Leishmania donovani]CAJ1993189.1 hypothetical protein conserved [Leishmania donovani]VDZ49016.1 hypothetical_protein_conserved [Leishmania donovani]